MGPTFVSEASSLRKAAIVVAALGPEAETLLAQLPAELAGLLRREASALQLRESQEELLVLSEFLAAWEGKRSEASGRDHQAHGPPQESILSRGHGGTAPPNVMSKIRAAGFGPSDSASGLGERKGVLGSVSTSQLGGFSRSAVTPALATTVGEASPAVPPQEHARMDGGAGRPFDRLRASEAEAIAYILAKERPQTIALVLSHLPPEQAGQVLTRFAPAQQVEIIRRLVDLEETHPEVLSEIEKALEERLAQIIQAGKRRRAGMAAVRSIVEAAERAVRGQILTNLEVFDQELAKQLAPPPPRFEDLALLDELSLQALVRAAEPLVTQLALVGAPETLLRRFMGVLPAQERNVLRNRLQELGPTSLRDIDEARRRLCLLAQRLATMGQLDLPRFSTTTGMGLIRHAG